MREISQSSRKISTFDMAACLGRSTATYPLVAELYAINSFTTIVARFRTNLRMVAINCLRTLKQAAYFFTLRTFYIFDFYNQLLNKQKFRVPCILFCYKLLVKVINL